MRYLYLLLIGLFLSCGSGNTESTSEDSSSDTLNIKDQKAENSRTLSTNDNYAHIFTESTCDNITADEVSSILSIPAEKLQKSNSGCGWGYYPDDYKKGGNIRVKFIDDENTTITHFDGDEKTMREMSELEVLEYVKVDATPEVIATYRKDRGWLKVYISNSRMLEIQIYLKRPDESVEDVKNRAIRFAELILSK